MVADPAPRPAKKVFGIVGQSTHPAGGDVEHVSLHARAVRDAPADGPESIDERDPDGTAAAQQLRGDGDAGEAAAHDRDLGRRVGVAGADPRQGTPGHGTVRRTFSRHSAAVLALDGVLRHSGLRPELYFRSGCGLLRGADSLEVERSSSRNTAI